MEHGSRHRLAVFGVAAVLAGGLGAASAANALAAGNADSGVITTIFSPASHSGEASSGIGIHASKGTKHGHETSVGPSYALEVDGVVIGQIQEVSGLPGQPTGGEVALTRRLTDDNSFQKWMEDSRRNPSNARKNGMITLYDSEGSALQRYKFTNALPKSLEQGTMTNGAPTEKLVLTYESMNSE